MNRTRLTAHTSLLATLGLLACAIWLLHTSLLYAAFGFIGAWTSAGLTTSSYLKAHREQQIARSLVQLRDQPAPRQSTLTPAEEQAFATIVALYGKDHPA